jgi:hypothetical protein
MSLEHTPDGGVAESMDETHSQPRFLGYLAMTLLLLAVLFALVCLYGAMTHPAVVL